MIITGYWVTTATKFVTAWRMRVKFVSLHAKIKWQRVLGKGRLHPRARPKEAGL